jgi:predicted transcriptional regulator
VFTVKLPVDLVRRLRRYSRTNHRTLSFLVAQALEEFLARRGGG